MEDIGELLNDRLAQPFVVDRDSKRGMPASSRAPRQITTAELTGTIGDVLREPNVTASTLEKLKEFGRKLFSEGMTPPQRDVGLTIYYGAIANALVHHDLRITRLSFQELRQSLAALVDKEWMPTDFKSLFREAYQTCESLERRHSRASGK